MSKSYNVAVVGASGAVGSTMLSILDERKFPINNLYPLASARSAGSKVEFGEDEVRVGLLDDFDFADADIALFSAGASVSAIHAPVAASRGCVVIDNTSHFRYQDAIPLIVPEVNFHRLEGEKSAKIIANPNCSTIQMVVALKPIHDAATITRINVSTYQSTSGAGNLAVDELASQTTALLNGKPALPKVFPLQIAFNAIPHIDQFMENGFTKEEMKMIWETRKIMELPELKINATAVRIASFYSHGESIQIQTAEKISVVEIRRILSTSPGVQLLDSPEPGGYPTPVSAAGHDDVFVGRIREDLSCENGINLWVVSDNIRKGAALNSIQIAEQMVAHDLL